MNEFDIEQNAYLTSEIHGYYHQLYTGYGNPENPVFLNILKNTFNSCPIKVLIAAKSSVERILNEDIPLIISNNNITDCVLMSVPRSKKEDCYESTQLFFRDAVSRSANNIGIIDGTRLIKRVEDTFTTHFYNAKPMSGYENNGDMPYPGITQDTCVINRNVVAGKHIILIDDIYTRTVNVDEDCIQALLDNGASEIIFYSIGYTRRN